LVKVLEAGEVAKPGYLYRKQKLTKSASVESATPEASRLAVTIKAEKTALSSRKVWR
jgi:hypothetical protein